MGIYKDLEDLARESARQDELTDPFTGVVFTPKAANHYEFNDGVPFAPPLDLPRPTLRQRIENLTRQGYDPLARYVHDGSEDTDFDVPDDPEAPLTASEANYIDMVAADLAEAAPLPDEGLPRQQQLPQSEVPLKAAETPGGGGSAADLTPPGNSVPTR